MTPVVLLNLVIETAFTPKQAMSLTRLAKSFKAVVAGFVQTPQPVRPAANRVTKFELQFRSLHSPKFYLRVIER